METGAARSQDRVSKRTSNACVRCRRLKIKCSGLQPCDGCSKRRVACELDQRDQKIVVTRGYIMDLQNSVQEAEQRRQRRDSRGSPIGERAGQRSNEEEISSAVNGTVQQEAAGGPSNTYATPRSEDIGFQAPAPQESPGHTEPASLAVENSLSLRHAEFTTSAAGVTYYLGTSSNWSFTRRILNLTHSQVCNSPAPPQALIFDGGVYEIDWGRLKMGSDDPNLLPELPTLDHAIFLINTVQFNCCQLFHLFDTAEFMESCHKFYANPTPDIASAGLWYIHFCLVIALGKAFQSRRHGSDLPFGQEFLLSVFRQFPNTGALIQQPLLSVEILCCAALCLQCIDHRHYAHSMIGEALRISLFQGWHTEMPPLELGDRYVERCRRAWWTVYILDREFTSLMGLPLTIQDDDVNCPLPKFDGQMQRMATLEMQVKLCRNIADINKRLYGGGGSLHRKYLSRAKEILGNIADVAEELRTAFPLQPKENMNGISRTASHLHLLYHRCITLVTRPLLFYLLKTRFASFNEYFSTLESLPTVRNLVRMCIESSQTMVSILECLMNQGLLGAFFPYDTEAIFVSTTNLLLGPAIDPQFINGGRIWLQRAFVVFDDMINCGNQVAKFRKDELLQLDELLELFGTVAPLHRPEATGADAIVPATQRHDDPNEPDVPPADLALGGPAGDVYEQLQTDDGPSRLQIVDPMLGDSFGAGFSKEQIMGVADAIDDEDMAWMRDIWLIIESSI
ncbi:putative transcriptional regulatory protein C3C7.04 like [Verticillium longisporum]|nr:putative transcriptional regulatory protein C3C7.04 like [Verticillium longisporum]